MLKYLNNQETDVNLFLSPDDIKWRQNCKYVKTNVKRAGQESASDNFFLHL